MLQQNVSLIPYSNYRIGGPAAFFAAPKKYDDILVALDAWRKRRGSPSDIFVLGGGTNLLISDDGFPGLVLKPELTKYSSDHLLVTAEGGVAMVDLLDFAARRGLSGLEWAGGLPGTLGGAIRGNAGAFNGEIKDAVHEVTSLDISGHTPNVVKRRAGECHFNYRTSIFKECDGKEIVLAAMLKLKRGDKKAIRAGIEEKIAYRNARHPMEYPNIGSIFKNIDWCSIPRKHRDELNKVVKLDPFPVVPAAYLIAQTGLKGVSFGGAAISAKHPNFIVNVLRARAADVKQLIKLVKAKVNEQFDVTLEEEVRYV